VYVVCVAFVVVRFISICDILADIIGIFGVAFNVTSYVMLPTHLRTHTYIHTNTYVHTHCLHYPTNR
jgi:hypothetical protein